MWEFLNSNLGLLLVGFACTGIVGSFLNSKIQTKVWERQKKHDLLVQSLADGRHLFDEINVMLNRRTFGLLKVLWAIDDAETENEILKHWEDYYPTVRAWNENLQSLRFKAEAIGGKDVADRLLDYSDVASSSEPKSIHYRMRRAHSLVRELRDLRDGEQKLQLSKMAKKQLDHLQAEIEEFLRMIAKKLLYSEQTLSQQIWEYPKLCV